MASSIVKITRNDGTSVRVLPGDYIRVFFEWTPESEGGFYHLFFRGTHYNNRLLVENVDWDIDSDPDLADRTGKVVELRKGGYKFHDAETLTLSAEIDYYRYLFVTDREQAAQYGY